MDFLDGWRSLAVLFMLVWHALWDLESVGLLRAGLTESLPMSVIRGAVPCIFVVLAGIGCRLSRSNLRRGVRLCACALGVTVVTWVAGRPVWFGILHLLGVCCLLWAAGGRTLSRLPAGWCAAACLAAFAALRLALEPLRVSVPGLWALGLRTAEFSSADYYPLLPWAFLFLAGAFAGGPLLDSDASWKTLRLPPALTWPGRHALVLYLVHQPVLYGLALLLARAG